jgi:hypothetical protein
MQIKDDMLTYLLSEIGEIYAVTTIFEKHRDGKGNTGQRDIFILQVFKRQKKSKRTLAFFFE